MGDGRAFQQYVTDGRGRLPPPDDRPVWDDGPVTDPRHDQPYGAAPQQPGYPPQDATYPRQDATSYGAPTPYGPQGGQLQPGAHGYAGYAQVEPPRTPALGRVALVVGIIALVGSTINGVAVLALFRVDMLDSSDPDGSFGLVASVGLANVLLVWFLLGLWAIVQGGIAIGQKRGVGSGIGAVVLGLIAPWIGVTIAFVGVLSQISQYSTT